MQVHGDTAMMLGKMFIAIIDEGFSGSVSRLSPLSHFVDAFWRKVSHPRLNPTLAGVRKGQRASRQLDKSVVGIVETCCSIIPSH